MPMGVYAITFAYQHEPISSTEYKILSTDNQTLSTEH